MRGARHLGRRPIATRHGRRRGVVEQAAQHQRRLGLRRRQHLEGHVGEHGERAPRAGHHLRQIVAGDVLDHPPAGLERLAPAGHGVDAEHMVARRTRLDAPRPGKIGGKHAADRAAARLAAEQRPVVHRLEGEFLAVLGKQLLDLGERRAGPGRQHQFLRLVERHAGELDRSSVCSVCSGRPMPRFEPWPTISSGAFSQPSRPVATCGQQAPSASGGECGTRRKMDHRCRHLAAHFSTG